MDYVSYTAYVFSSFFMIWAMIRLDKIKNERIDDLSRRLDGMEKRISLLDSQVDMIS